MIIDRIFSLVNKRALEPKWETKVATASNIQHPQYAFERLADGSFVIESLEEDISKLKHYFYEIQLRQIEGKYTLVAVLNRNPAYYINIFLSLLYAFLFFVSVATLNPFFILIYFIFIGVIVVQQKVICHFIFNNVEYTLFKADYKP